MHEDDPKFIRLAIAVAQRARAHGNHPFGALLVDENGQILLEAENTVVTANDATGHAETNLIRLASKRYSPDFLAQCTLYTSTEPCAMCAGAIFWGNVFLGQRAPCRLWTERSRALCHGRRRYGGRSPLPLPRTFCQGTQTDCRDRTRARRTRTNRTCRLLVIRG